jgi:hypothetical protein
MISGTYLGSAVVVVVLAVLLRDGILTTASFIALLVAAFFLASAGASSAYLTVSEVFPLEIRGLAIALFYAVGTAVGGITGPLLFGNMIHSGDRRLVAVGFLVGAAAMALGGIAELVLGVRAEGRPLENIATPLTAEEEAADPVDRAAIRAARDIGRPGGPDGALGSRSGGTEARDGRIGERARHDRLNRRPWLGPGVAFYSPSQIGTAGTTSRWSTASAQALDREIEVLSRAVERHGPLRREVLIGYLGARDWGPGRFAVALRYALEEGRVRTISTGSYGGPVGSPGRAPSERAKPSSAPPVG